MKTWLKYLLNSIDSMSSLKLKKGENAVLKLALSSPKNPQIVLLKLEADRRVTFAFKKLTPNNPEYSLTLVTIIPIHLV